MNGFAWIIIHVWKYLPWFLFLVPESQITLQSKGNHPTVAIITCLFVEKQCIDLIIEQSSTSHKYSKSGDSNVYTIGMNY